MSRENQPPFFMVIDCESVGLHGETFAVAYVVVDPAGREVDSGCFSCDPALASGDDAGREWVKKNVTVDDPDTVPCDDPADVRGEFWGYWQKWKAKGAVMAADCLWPVEARFLAACVDDASWGREWGGPYPFHEVASVRLAAGFDPLATLDRLPNELPAHDPLADARQSARLLIEALAAVAPGPKV